MEYKFSVTAIAIFIFFVGAVLSLSFYLGRKAKSAKGFYAAHGQIGWFVNGVAFAGDYLSAASFLGICGLIAFFGYDGFLYSIGFLAGWIVALFVIAEPIKRLGKFTFADALDSRFNSRGIKLAVAISTLVVSIFYLIPQMVGAGTLITPLLGLSHEWGVLIVGIVVTLIVTTAGMVSTTWVQFIKGSLLVFFCFILTMMILNRGVSTHPAATNGPVRVFRRSVPLNEATAGGTLLPGEKGWEKYVRIQDTTGRITAWHIDAPTAKPPLVSETQTVTIKGGQKYINGVHIEGKLTPETDLMPIGQVAALPGGQTETGPLGPIQFLKTIGSPDTKVITWGKEKEDFTSADGSKTTVYYQKISSGADLLTPGGYFVKIKSTKLIDKLDFLSLMLALFCGTASLPHILIRYYTVKDQAAARKSTIVGIASIGFFYVLTLFLGLGAMTSGALDVTNNNMAAPLLAKSFNQILFAIISAIAFTTVLGTVSGLIMAGAGAVAHDFIENTLNVKMDDHRKVLWGKGAAVVLGIIAMILGVKFKTFNVSFLVGWAFAIAASANLPALVMLLFWKGTTKQGITASVIAGLLASLGWILCSADCYTSLYKLNLATHRPIVPFSQPGLVTIPFAFAVLVVVSLMTKPKPVA